MRKKGLLALILILAVFLSGFSADFDNAGVRADTEAVLDALIDGDYMAFRAAINDRVAGDELTEFFREISAGLAGIEDYELTAVEQKLSLQDGLSYISVLYEMTAGDLVLEIEAVKVDGESGLAGFHIEEAEAQAEEAPRSAIHWAFMAVAVATVAFTIWMVVDCVRRKMKRKWLWIALIVLLSLYLTVTVLQGHLNFRFNFGIFLGLTDVNIYTDGSFAAEVYVPLGALIYLTQRKKLTLREERGEVTEGPKAADA